jgi:hypothetical protein
MASASVFIAAQQILNRTFTYWDVDDTGLKERRLWNIRTVPWAEITYVRAASNANPDCLAIDFARSAPVSDRGTITANPIEMTQFIDILRKFAPQASFEIQTFGRALSLELD